MRLYFIAGERSGDLHGGNLIKAIRQLQPVVQLRGFGGDRMKAEGMELVGHYAQMAFMGIIQVLLNLRKVSERMSACQSDILTWKPDAVVLIDYGGFNMRLARFLKSKNIRVVYYISPKVWAWNTGRAKKLKATVDQMLCILPFEKKFFKQFDWDVEYVGNPVLDAVKAFKPDPDFLTRHELSGKEIIALLPGSRVLELKRIIPLLAEVTKQFPENTFVVAAIRELSADLYAPLQGLPNIRFVFEETYDLLHHSRAAVVTSGTATLETGLFRVPQAVVYKATALEYAIGSRVVSVDYISLVNLIANAPVIREFLQQAASVENVKAELNLLLAEGPYREEILSGYEQVWSRLDIGSASENAAKLICQEIS